MKLQITILLFSFCVAFGNIKATSLDKERVKQLAQKYFTLMEVYSDLPNDKKEFSRILLIYTELFCKHKFRSDLSMGQIEWHQYKLKFGIQNYDIEFADKLRKFFEVSWAIEPQI